MLSAASPDVQAPSNSAASNPQRMLLVEPNLVARRTIATVIHELGMAWVEEAADAHAAARRLQDTPFAALLIDLGQDAAALDLITRVRQGHTACAHQMPVVAMSGAADPSMRRSLGASNAHLLVRPFKVRTVLELLRAMNLYAA